MLADLPHFNNARRYVVPLAIVGVILAAVGVGLTSAISAHANAFWRLDLPIPRALGFVGASLLVAAGGFLSAALLVFVRARLVDRPAAVPFTEPAPVEKPQAGGWLDWRGWLARARALFVFRVEMLAAWPQALVALVFAALAIAGVRVTWAVTPFAAADPTTLEILAGALFVAAFPLLVLERFYAAISAEMLPDALQLDRLLRLPLTVCLGLGIAAVLRVLDYGWVGVPLEQALAILIVAVAVEIVVRSLALAFVPFAPIEQRRSPADSTIAGLLRFSLPSFQAFNTAVRQQFGIDLSRSWALAFVQRAMLPVLVVLGLLAWCITGVTALGLNERAVYERFGRPIAVLGPGLHVHLPWPFGVMRTVELGVIHDIPIAMSAQGDVAPARQSLGVDQQQRLSGAEAAPPASADRLWDASHPSEQSYLIASANTNGQQSFQIADADLRVVYRVGLTDADAMNSAYRVAEPETLISAATGQLLVRYFARYTLPDVLGQSRDAFTKEFRVALQDELDKMGSGIEAIAVVVEAIHPPAGAASAYHNVQAAEILANSQISVQKASAIHSVKSAQQAAMEDRNKATAAAAELVNQAQSESILFNADRQARARDGEAFLTERRFERLSSGLAKSEAVVIDHRLKGPNGPLIDLRSFGGAGGVPAARRDVILPPGRTFNSEEDDDEPTLPPVSGSQR